MKIVTANNYYYLRGGAERVMFDETASLVGAGHEVIPFSQCHPQNTSTRYNHYYIPAIDFWQIEGLEKCKTALNIVYSRKQRSNFGSLLDEIQPSLVHGHNIYGGLTYSIVHAAKQRSIPFVLTLHDCKLVCPSYLMLNHGAVCELCLGGRFWNCLLQRCHKESLQASFVYTVEAYINAWTGSYDWISRFLIPSRFLLEKHAAAGFPREKLVYLPNALEPSAYEPSFSDGKYVLFVGRLSKEKGLLTLLRAFEGLPIPLRIAGTGPVKAEALRYVEKHGMTNVFFEGYCSGTKLKELYRRAAFIVVPSEWYENAPMSVLEAFAYGKPVVGSRIGGIPELVLPGFTGSLFEPRNCFELREKIEEHWNNKKISIEMGCMARERIENEFSAKQHLSSLLDIYHAALAEH